MIHLAGMLPITDAHQHLWNLERLSLPWLGSLPKLNRTHDMAEYLRAAQGLGIRRSVYVEVDVEPGQRVLEAEQVGELCRDPSLPLQAMVASADPASQEFSEHLSVLLTLPHVHGVRRVLHTPDTPRGYCLAERFVAGVRELGRHGLSFDLCVRNDELEDAARLAELCPETQFIVDHCGNADPVVSAAWQQGMQKLAALPNTVCKLSGIVIRLPEGESLDKLAPTLDTCIEMFGTERVLFGSDWPVCTLRAELGEWVTAARAILAKHSLGEQRRMLDENAVRVYRLS